MPRIYLTGSGQTKGYATGSGMLNNPIRILLQEKDFHTGSYPTIARTGDPDFSGRFPSYFDDNKIINFVGGDLIYPTTLPASSFWVSGNISTPNILQGLQAVGTSSKGVADAHVLFTPGENISAFNDSRIYIDNDSAFYQTGTDSSILPGFDQRLGSKTIINIDITPTTETTVVFSTGTIPGPSVGGIDEGVNSGLAYFNFADKRWEIIGDLSTGSNVDYYNNSLVVATGSYLATIPAQYFAVGLASWDMGPFNSALGSPTDFAGFPYATKFNATSSQLYNTTSSLNSPFLIEKIALEFSGVLAQYSLIGANVAEQPQVTTFMLMLQRDQPITGSYQTVSETVNLSSTPNVLTSTSTSYDYNTDRRIIWYGRIGKYSLINHPTVASIISNFGIETYNSCDLWLPAASSTTSLTGSFRLEGVPKIPSPAPRATAAYYSRKNNSAFSPIFGRQKSGRNLQETSDGRSFIRSVIGSKVVSSSLSYINTSAGNLPFYKYDSESQFSPFVLLPGDKLILAYSNQSYPYGTAGSSDELSVAKQHTKLSPGASKLTLFGSLLRENLPASPETNQPLTSDAIHEDLHYDNSVFDQFDVEPYAALTGSYTDLIIDGSIFGSYFFDVKATGSVTIVNSGTITTNASATPDEVTLISTDGTSKTYIFMTGTTGNLYGSKVIVSTDGGPNNLLASRFSTAIASANGHNGKITASAASEPQPVKVSLTQDVKGFAGNTDISLLISSNEITAVAFNGGIDRDLRRVIGSVAAGQGGTTGSLQRFVKLTSQDDQLYDSITRNFTGSNGSSPLLTQSNYGLTDGRNAFASAKARRDKYGQYRDLLETIPNSVFVLDGVNVDREFRPVEINFLSRPGKDGRGRSPVDPTNTFSQNLSAYSTSSLPFFDADKPSLSTQARGTIGVGNGRDRSDYPDFWLKPVEVTVTVA